MPQPKINELSSQKPIYKGFLVLFAVAGCCLMAWLPVNGQEILPADPLVSVDADENHFNTVLTQIEKQIPYRFAFNTDLITKQKNITLHVKNLKLSDVLSLLLQGTNLKYSIIENQIVLELRPPPRSVTICGYIKNSLSGESLPGAVIYLPEKKIGTYTNNYGFYSLTLSPVDSLQIWISYVGYNSVYTKTSGQLSYFKNYLLSERNIQLYTVNITSDESDDNIKKNILGKTVVSMDMIKTVPSISGNGDVISTIQMMPGVSAAQDGRPGYFIRGGNTDQNLVQLDEATIFNPTHLLGLISIFNTPAIKNVTLLKGGFPASFGDYLSSVLDVSMLDGNYEQIEGNLELSSISSGLTLSGPLIAHSSSFLFSVRRSTMDLFFMPFDLSNYFSNYNFYDINAKLNFRVSQNDRLFLSFYQGRDHSAYSNDSTSLNPINYSVHYGNQAFTARWNHLFSPKVFLNTSVIYNNYYHYTSASQQQYYAELYSGIRDLDLKSDVNIYPGANHKISTGINYLSQILSPATLADQTSPLKPNTTINPDEIPKKYSYRLALYVSDEIRLSPKFSAYLGARVPICYTQNARYSNFEPRVAILHLINPTTSINLSYTEMHQYLHLVQSYNASFPAELWIGSSKIVQPQNCQQASLGLNKNFNNNMIQTSVEVYYKHFGNQLLFKGGLTPTITNDMDSSLIFGQGQSYGTEFLFKKNNGRFNGWIAYTFSFAYQQFDSLNLGKKFPFANDIRHNLSFSTSYTFNTHWDITSDFILNSGRAFTLFKYSSANPSWQYGNPLYYNTNNNSGFSPGGNSVEPNNYRLVPYNRLDLSVRYRKTKTLAGRMISSFWTFSVYNVYARANTYFAYCSIDPISKQPIAVQVSFVPIIPSISYTLEF